MKNIYNTAIFCLTAILSAACAKVGNEVSVATVDYEPVELVAGMPTKVFSSGTVMKWQSGEETMTVVGENGGIYDAYTFTKPASTSATSAVFSGSVASGSALRYAVYPAVDGNPYDAGTKKLSLSSSPSMNNAVANSVPTKTPLYAIISGTDVSMVNPCAFLKVTLPTSLSSQSLAIFPSLKVTAAGCCGDFTVDLTDPATPVVSKGDENTISVVPRDGKSGVIYVPVLPGSYDDVTITVTYNDGHVDFSRRSTKAQTFESGKYYDCGSVAGPYVESLSVRSRDVTGTTLSVEAVASVWKYAGVTNSDYTFKFLYRESGTSGDWTEFAASSVSGDGTSVTFGGSTTVESGKTYEVKAAVVAGSFVTEVAAGNEKTVVFNLSSRPDNFVYNTPTAADAGFSKIVDSEGNDIFPAMHPSASKADYYRKKWDGTSFGAVEHISGTSITGVLGGTFTQTVDGADYSITFENSSSTTTYSIFGGLFCSGNKYAICINCPASKKIKALRLQVTSGRSCTYGIGSSATGTCDVYASAAYGNTSEAVDVTLQIASPSADTPYYLIGGATSNRLNSLTVYYDE